MRRFLEEKLEAVRKVSDLEVRKREHVLDAFLYFDFTETLIC